MLLSLDGMEFVLSRTGILDIFLMCFVLAAFGAMLIDRDVSRSRLAQAVVLRPRTPQFDYYSLEFLPFLVLCITLCLGLITGPARASPRRRVIGAAIAGIYVLAVLMLFWSFYPILAGHVIPYSSWSARMWYRGWI